VRDVTAKSWLPVAALALLLSIAAACGSSGPDAETDTEAAADGVGQMVEAEGGSYVDVSPRGLQSMLGGKDFRLVNVHIPYAGEIESTDQFIPYDQIAERLDELPGPKDSKIVVYCRSGGMSAIAARTLVSLGYANVWNLDGGMIAWEEAGYPLLNAD
jgi:rhodanese-related sulfurtransferase